MEPERAKTFLIFMLRTNFFKTVLASMLVVCVVVLYSCGGSKKSQNDEGVIDSKNIKINARSVDDLPGEWFKILDGKYTIEFDSQGYVWIKVSIQKTNSFDDYEINSIYAIPLNKKKEPIKSDESRDVIYMGLDKEEKFIEGSIGEYACKFVTYFFEDEEKNNFINNLNGLEIFYSSYKKSDYDDDKNIDDDDNDIDDDNNDNNDDNTNISSKTNSSSNNWDSLLDSYEKIAVEYEKLAKEMKSGNVNTSSLTKIVMESAKMQEKFDDSKNELTPKQAQRLTKITTKIAQAAASATTVNPKNVQSIDGINLKDLGL